MTRPSTQAVREYFLLAAARDTSRALGEADRTAVADALALARQQADSADALWTLGHTAEGLRLAVTAFDTTLSAARRFARALTEGAPELTAIPRLVALAAMGAFLYAVLIYVVDRTTLGDIYGQLRQLRGGAGEGGGLGV